MCRQIDQIWALRTSSSCFTSNRQHDKVLNWISCNMIWSAPLLFSRFESYLRFWNHVLICVSVSPRVWESSIRLLTLRYLSCWKRKNIDMIHCMMTSWHANSFPHYWPFCKESPHKRPVMAIRTKFLLYRQKAAIGIPWIMIVSRFIHQSVLDNEAIFIHLGDWIWYVRRCKTTGWQTRSNWTPHRWLV